MPVQLLRFKKATGGGEVWVNPEQVIYAEAHEKKEDKSKLTILHVTGKEGKLFIKESPEEVNRIFRSIKEETVTTYK